MAGHDIPAMSLWLEYIHDKGFFQIARIRSSRAYRDTRRLVVSPGFSESLRVGDGIAVAYPAVAYPRVLRWLNRRSSAFAC